MYCIRLPDPDEVEFGLGGVFISLTGAQTIPKLSSQSANSEPFSTLPASTAEHIDDIHILLGNPSKMRCIL